MPNANVNVAITPVGTSITQGVNFGFSAGTGMPTGLVSADGKIDFSVSKQYASGTAVMIVYTITTPTITFTTGPSVGTFGLNFYSSTNGAKDACYIALWGQNPGVYNGTEFVFGPNALGPKSASLAIQDNNDDGLQYAYELWVWVVLSAGSGQKFYDDPRLINHPRNK